jgi:hypothetical protein
MKSFTITFLISFFTFLNHGFSQTEKGTLLLGGSASYLSVDDESLININPNLGYFVANKFVVGLNANYINSDGSNILGLGPYVRGYFLTTEKGSIFAQVGYNYLKFSGDFDSDSENGYSLGLGYAVFLNNSVALELSGNYVKYDFANSNTLFSAGDSGIFSFSVGFQIHFKKE